jgi:hypothetical protein
MALAANVVCDNHDLDGVANAKDNEAIVLLRFQDRRIK